MRRLTMSFAVCLAFLAAVSGAEAGPLTVVDVNAPAINCLFDPACKVVVTDTASPIALSGTAGTAFLQSRTFKGKPGTAAAGFIAYEYRIDLRQAYGIVSIPCLTSMTLPIGSLGSLDFNSDGAGGDQVFVVTSGGLGTVGLAGATRVGFQTTFTFESPVCAGSSPGNGDSTFFFGVVSKANPKYVNATLTGQGGPYSVQARAPGYLLLLPGNYFGFFTLVDSSSRGTASLSITEQAERRLTATLMLDGTAFALEGTAAASGEVVATGGARGERILLRGVMRDADGLLVLEAQFQRISGRGSREIGSLVLVQDPASVRAP